MKLLRTSKITGYHFQNLKATNYWWLELEKHASGRVTKYTPPHKGATVKDKTGIAPCELCLATLAVEDTVDRVTHSLLGLFPPSVVWVYRAGAKPASEAPQPPHHQVSQVGLLCWGTHTHTQIANSLEVSPSFQTCQPKSHSGKYKWEPL